eukprot:CAMPEP_0172708748 /NCGR_PEP_ID=MMETSP1074-20121228/52020_1 /TAXON_ID=2916 /ORGANISM="Ceratium fusus, Strain PA161109" /LENGTH=166 /DNA_ID=CAMNT_0013531789 /DNA_START=81 /DNA_END=578 /DNA_ORIENTATION=-
MKLLIMFQILISAQASIEVSDQSKATCLLSTRASLSKQTEPPKACKQFFLTTCGMMAVPSTPAAMLAEFEKCCTEGGHSSILCSEMGKEIFSVHKGDAWSFEAQDRTCTGMNDLSATDSALHDDKAASEVVLAETALDATVKKKGPAPRPAPPRRRTRRRRMCPHW